MIIHTNNNVQFIQIVSGDVVFLKNKNNPAAEIEINTMFGSFDLSVEK